MAERMTADFKRENRKRGHAGIMRSLDSAEAVTC
jgi:hypothetical protein